MDNKEENNMVIYTRLARLLSGGKRGITLYPFILIIPELRDDEVILNHERIHIEQQRELYVGGFYVLYVLYWLYGLLTGPQGAYRNIPFEREAYDNQQNADYLSIRAPHSWTKYRRGK